MAEIRHRKERSAPHIKVDEIYFPDRDDLGTGTYTVEVERSALASPSPFLQMVVKRPVFQLALRVTRQNEELSVALGSFDPARPPVETVYRLRAGATGDRPSNDLVVQFRGWAVESVTLDGEPLAKIRPLVN